jgi:hypothetical protein
VDSGSAARARASSSVPLTSRRDTAAAACWISTSSGCAGRAASCGLSIALRTAARAAAKRTSTRASSRCVGLGARWSVA